MSFACAAQLNKQVQA